MSADVPANVRGVSTSFDHKDPDRDNLWPPYQLPKHLFELREKWCEQCGRRHAQEQCQYLMADHMIKEGIAEKKALTERLFQEGLEGELQRRLRNWRAVEALRESHVGTNGGNTASAGQQQQQTNPIASRLTGGTFEVSDSEDEFNYEDESDVDDESDSDDSESAPSSAPEATLAKKQSETGKSKEREESLYLFVVLPVAFLLILCACLIYLVAKFGLRLGLAVYDV